MTYRPDIDGLRAVAVLSVLCFHAYPALMPGGFVGVDVFFVISGFLISGLIFEDLADQRLSILRFYQRRIRRILPTLILIMLSSLVVGWFMLFPKEYAQLATHVAAGAGFCLNIVLWQESGYFDHAAQAKPMLHLWSLAVEEQFYLLWPLLLAALGRKQRRDFVFPVLVLGLLSFWCNLYLSNKSSSTAFYLPLTRFWELMAGAMCAARAMKHPKAEAAYPHVQSVAGALLIVAGFVLIDRSRAFPGWWALLPTGGSLLLINAGEKAVINRYLLSSAPMVAVGLISYPLYLWHWPLLSFLHIATSGHPAPMLISAALALALALAWLSYQALEKPIRAARGHRHVWPLLGALMALVALSALIRFNDGLPTRAITHKLDQLGRPDVFAASRQADGSCTKQLGLAPLKDEVCLSTTHAPRLMIAGDSHAMALYSAIQAGMTKGAALLVSSHGCDIYPGLTYAPSYQRDWGNHCTPVARRVMDLVQAKNTLDTVLLVSHYPPLDEGASPYRLGTAQLSKRQAFLEGLAPLIDEAHKAGKKMVLLVDVPYLKQDPLDCIQRLPFLPARECRYTPTEHAQLRREYMRQIRQLQAAHPHLTVYDPTSLFCPGAICLDQLAGQQLYNDSNHISAWASAILLNKMRAEGVLDF